MWNTNLYRTIDTAMHTLFQNNHRLLGFLSTVLFTNIYKELTENLTAGHGIGFFGYS